MADVAELTAGVGRAAPLAPPDADAFLPSKPLADALRDLSKQQRALHAQVTNFAAELAARLRPAATNPFAPLEARQRAIAADALTLAKQFASPPATNAAGVARLAADRLLVGRGRAAADAAETFRQFAAGGGPAWGNLAARQEAPNADLAALPAAPNAVVAQQVACARTRPLCGRVRRPA